MSEKQEVMTVPGTASTDCDRAPNSATGEAAGTCVATDDQIKHMVERFLAWRLPEDFQPDDGISFKAEFNEHTAHPMKHQPTGTNLFSYRQAEAMVRHMIGRREA